VQNAVAPHVRGVSKAASDWHESENQCSRNSHAGIATIPAVNRELRHAAAAAPDTARDLATRPMIIIDLRRARSRIAKQTARRIRVNRSATVSFLCCFRRASIARE